MSASIGVDHGAKPQCEARFECVVERKAEFSVEKHTVDAGNVGC